MDEWQDDGESYNVSSDCAEGGREDGTDTKNRNERGNNATKAAFL